MRPCLAVVIESEPGKTILEPISREMTRCIVRALCEHEVVADQMGLLRESKMARQLISRLKAVVDVAAG